ncbi:hypothetical protein LJC11_00370 [Bacteroidales bacterium OttesenSCG-928-I21]|nr:hypothetical protein [Bacteroidales bacterium OttesenSCG-928-I21]
MTTTIKDKTHKKAKSSIFLLLSFVFCIVSISGFSQTDDNYSGARSTAMGRTGLTLQDTWAVFNNPAAISNLKTMNIGVFYESRFLMKETGYGAIAFTAPLLGGNIGFGATHFGFDLFQQNKIALGYSQKLFKNFSMGLNINYFSTRQSEIYGNFNAMTLEIGLLATPINGLSIATYVFNPFNLSYFEDSDFKLPIAIKLGISYLFSNKLLLAVETGKAINGYIPVFKSGIEYKINQHFAFRGGISLKPIEYTIGVGYNTHGVNIDLAFGYHQILGSTPKISVHYEF